MNTTLLKRARSLFCCDMVPAHTARHNMRSWARSVRFLGDKSLLAVKVQRKEL